MLYLLKVYVLVAAPVFGLSGLIIVGLFFVTTSQFRELFRDAAGHLRRSFRARLNDLVIGKAFAMHSAVSKGGFKE